MKIYKTLNPFIYQFFYSLKMQTRNVKGQFQKVKEDVFSVLDLIALIWKLLPFLILLLIVYNNYEIHIRQFLFKALCGKDGHSCSCKLTQEKIMEVVK